MEHIELSPVATANPAMAVFGTGRMTRGVAAVLRATHRFMPRVGTWLALGVFFTPLPLKLVARRQVLPAPWRAEHWPFEHATLTAYRRPDVRADAPVVLLAHGWAGDAMQLRLLGDALAQRGFNPVLLDFPAHGRSAGWRTTLPQFVRGLWAASARLGPLHGIVAHSMGALAASHAAASGLPVRRLALVSPSPAPREVLGWFIRGFGLGEALMHRMGGRIERNEGIDLDHFEWPWLAARLTQPLLVVHDESDKVTPHAIGQAVAAEVAQGRLHTTHGLGHRRVLADAGVIGEVVQHMGT